MIKHTLPEDPYDPEPRPPRLPETIVAITFLLIVWFVATFLVPWALP